METEIWKDIPEYEGLYQASNLGRIKSINSKRRNHDVIMSDKSIANNGYIVVCLKRNGKPKTHSVHRLIAKTFIPNPYNYPVINHKNENKLDNRVENLEWCTYSYNISYGSNRYKRALKLGKKVFCVELNKTFVSIKEAGRITNIPYQNIASCCRGKLKSAGGYHWQFLEPQT